MNKPAKIKLFFEMLRIRMVEEEISEKYYKYHMRCPVHLCSGQEAISAGVCANLTKEDYAMGSHRNHGYYLAKGGSLKAMIAELCGKATGCSKGKGGSMHMVDIDANFLGSTPIVAGIIPVAVGVALGSVIKKENRITVVFFGDAATEEGVFFESLNFAALRKLPVIFVCENNLYSVYSHIHTRQPKERDNVALAGAYGVYGSKGCGNDVMNVYKITNEAVSRVHNGRGPVYLEFETYRLREHCGPNYDDTSECRSEAEFREWLKRCPVERYRKYLLEAGIVDNRQIETFEQDIRKEIAEAFEFAKNSPFPDKDEIYADI